ncbi:MAG: GNAT family N-acetyltransferase [Firmicutes bacterium]|nr:GNAT family N-acetyltransferase [Bacillota bacterium]
MIEIKKNLEKYYQLFDTYDVFDNFIKYAVKDLKPQIYVDQKENPNCVVFYSSPAYFILGEPNEKYSTNVLGLFSKDSWIIASSNAWKKVINEHFLDAVQTHKRILFNSKSLDINNVLKQRMELPKGFSIQPIEKKHISEGMIYDDVISRFFTKSDFLIHGYGFTLIDNDETCHGFALTNYPIIGKDVELYFRVGYDHYPDFRLKGLGTTLCTYFIEESLQRGYNPVWDSANDISSHIAKKLGYIEEKEWYMYHVLK